MKSNKTEQSDTPAYKVYSDILQKPFNTVEELVAAEENYHERVLRKEAQIQQKKQRAEEVEQALKDLEAAKVEAREILVEANKKSSEVIKTAEDKYRELKRKFIDDYGAFHMSYYNDNGNETVRISDLVDSFFDNDFWLKFYLN